ncbi:hypothetical protein K7887_22630 (plasmid) [Sutcliffiella horikoshii]|uniref:Rad52/Rad22 family DNA repair protein n=1 Tax=Sutcliffiella horikoshii TaxID=79883 RepID=UPI001CBCBA3B|nr:Rad52/Rad22 family DNA repair protein [Sutcliffiella horikoshii]UAL49765.1 hypothetical protein K7887_22630 [Sutcliffiella horikoshii]
MTKNGINCTEGPLLSIYELQDKLKDPFPEKDIEWRVQRCFNTNNGPKAIVVPYVQNRAIMERLDAIFGPFGWENNFKEIHGGVLCGITVNINGNKTTKWDGADLTNIEPTKGAISSSMKRAAVQFGIGRYLYDLTEVWVDVHQNRTNQKGENYLNDKKQNITGYWINPELPNWALPVGAKTTAPKQKAPVQGGNGPIQGNVSNQRDTNQQTSSVGNSNVKPFNKKDALRAIADQERIIDMPLEAKFPLFLKANPGTKSRDLNSASENELQSYYWVLKPVAALIACAKQNKLTADQLLNYCQIVLKVPLQGIPDLFFKVKKEDVEQIISMIRQEAQVRTA